MLYQPIVSLIVAFATASCASATPFLRRGDDGYSPPSSSTSVSQCNTGTQQCCNEPTTADDPAAQEVAAENGVALAEGQLVWLGCAPGIGTTCGANPVCCQDVHQDGLINVGCTPMTL